MLSSVSAYYIPRSCPALRCQATATTQGDMMAKVFTPNVCGPSGGRPAYSLLQMYRCMILKPGFNASQQTHVNSSCETLCPSPHQWPHVLRNIQLRSTDMFKSALTAALQLASGSREMGDKLQEVTWQTIMFFLKGHGMAKGHGKNPRESYIHLTIYIVTRLILSTRSRYDIIV